MSDLDDVAENYDQLNADGESWESITGRVEAVGDKRLAAFLRQRAGGEDPEAVTAAPVARTGGQRSVTAQEADDAAAEAAAAVAAVVTAVADAGGEK